MVYQISLSVTVSSYTLHVIAVLKFGGSQADLLPEKQASECQDFIHRIAGNFRRSKHLLLSRFRFVDIFCGWRGRQAGEVGQYNRFIRAQRFNHLLSM